MSTRKPQEEEWALDGDGNVRRKNRRGESTTLICMKAATGELEAQALIAAAPAMARALLRANDRSCETIALLGDDCAVVFQSKPEDRCMVCDARAALTLAGVPLP